MSAVLVVGAGGLGSPVILYLAAAGIGTLGIVDYDIVEQSNLHRQIIHNEEKVGTDKAASACMAARNINSNIVCHQYNVGIDASNAMDIVRNFDVVVDASDNVATRYLLNDACVLLGKPLVSGSALRMEGQNGPCYRCLFPTPPPPETVTNCDDGGVLGPVTGVIGSMQALEVIKIVTKNESSYAQKMIFYDGWAGTFRTAKIRPRQESCAVCGTTRTITQLINYTQFCGSSYLDKTKALQLLQPNQRISPNQYATLRSNISHVLLDVRDTNLFQICALPGAFNIPLRQLQARIKEIKRMITTNNNDSPSPDVYVVCKRGNDSQLAVQMLQSMGISNCFDIERGLEGWHELVDNNFPIY